jgi:threonine/homoserine/homoserine lactone efflux protein
MLKYILIGGGFAFAAAAQPGPLQAFLISKVLSGGWKRTLPAALAPLASDGPIAVLVLFILRSVPTGFERFLKAAGGFLLLYFAGATFLKWRRDSSTQAFKEETAPRTFVQAVSVNLVNPGPYLGWSLVLGPLALEAWNQSPLHVAALIGAFYLTMVSCLAAFILFLGTTTFLGPRGRRTLLLLSSLALLVIGVYQLVSAVM